MEKCFLLKTDFTQCIDDFMTIHKLDMTDADLPHLINSSKYEFTKKKIFARANITHVVKFDFIANDLKIPIVSQRFIDASKISDCDEFDIIPLILIDDTFIGEFFDNEGNVKNEVNTVEGYFTLKFKIQQNYCDKDNSIFIKLASKPNSLGLIRKIVLKAPQSGFLKIFRIKETVSKLFVSGTMKKDLESMNIKGCIFEEVEVTQNLDA